MDGFLTSENTWQQGMCEPHGAYEIYIYDALKVVDRGVYERSYPYNACVVYENVDGGCAQLLQQQPYGGFGRNIHIKYPDVPVTFPGCQFGFQRLQSLKVHIGKQQVGALSEKQMFGQQPSNTRCCSCYEDVGAC
jgi:hypothetical protein